MIAVLKSRLRRARDWLVPEELGFGWMPILVLGYLVFLFLPLLFGGGAGGGLWWFGHGSGGFALTLLSVVVFLPLYFAFYRVGRTGQLLCMLGTAALGYALLPYNPFANTYLIYAAAMAAFLGQALWRRVGWVAAMMALFLLETRWLGIPLFGFALTLILSVAVFVGNHFQAESGRRQAELKLSHEEVRRLAAMAERERIGRDLHDLLGHTLSMVALKSELAGKLLAHDPAAARREIDEVARVAREALGQVRSAVSGIRSSGLAAELAAARLLLECDGVKFRYERAELALAPAQEAALALTLREAITNIQRHAGARSAAASLSADAGEAVLRVSDDGRGGDLQPGNGLTGMRERIESLGGRMQVSGRQGGGVALEARLPLSAGAAAASTEQPAEVAIR